MQDVTLIGIDLDKQSFHVHDQDRHGKALLRKKFNRKQLVKFFATFHVYTVVMEACAGTHHMARKLTGLGHEAKLISPQFVRPPSRATRTTSSTLRRSAKWPAVHRCGL
jgi:transposase